MNGFAAGFFLGGLAGFAVAWVLVAMFEVAAAARDESEALRRDDWRR